MKSFGEYITPINEAVENPVMDFFNDMGMLKIVYDKVKQVIQSQGLEYVPMQNRLIHAEKHHNSNYGGITLFMGVSNPGGTTVKTAKLEPQERNELDNAIREIPEVGAYSNISVYSETHGVRLIMEIETMGTY